MKLLPNITLLVLCGKGAYLFHKSSIRRISTNKVSVIDTTGAILFGLFVGSFKKIFHWR